MTLSNNNHNSLHFSVSWNLDSLKWLNIRVTQPQNILANLTWCFFKTKHNRVSMVNIIHLQVAVQNKGACCFINLLNKHIKMKVRSFYLSILFTFLWPVTFWLFMLFVLFFPFFFFISFVFFVFFCVFCFYIYHSCQNIHSSILNILDHFASATSSAVNCLPLMSAWIHPAFKLVLCTSVG